VIVLDSSVVLKWIFDDEDIHGKAIKYQQKHISGEETVIVPSLFFYEIANVLATKTRLSGSDAAESFLMFWNFDFEVIDFSLDEFLSVIDLSMHYKVSVYDASYIELARKLNCNFITADRKLYEKAREMKEVKLLMNS